MCMILGYFIYYVIDRLLGVDEKRYAALQIVICFHWELQKYFSEKIEIKHNDGV